MDSSIAAETTTPIVPALTAAALKEISHADQHSIEDTQSPAEIDPLAPSTSTETVQNGAVDTASTDATAEDNQDDVEVSSAPDVQAAQDSQEDIEIAPISTEDAPVEDSKDVVEIAPVATPDATPESHPETVEEAPEVATVETLTNVEVAPIPAPDTTIEAPEETREAEIAPIPTAVATIDSIAPTTAESRADDEVAAVIAATPMSTTEGEQVSKAKEQENVLPRSSKQDLSIETTSTTAMSKKVGQEPYTPSTPSTPSSSRPASREELRRRSSFFNSKDISVSSTRYTSTVSSLRPIADPRYKNRFQNVLAEWKARADSSKA
ncbi:hypothetical protein BGX31_010132 [Mortierella sp. GBA43]|nr:hypothetical protein BGX31_010132 [Mortierella sp. GBA43]